MITWRLWRFLSRPYTRHPMFRQLLVRRSRRQPLRLNDVLLLPAFLVKSDLWGILGGVVMVLLFCSGGWLIIFPLVIVTPFLLLFSGTLYGVAVAVWTSADFAVEHEKRRVDVTAVTPAGMAGLLWAITSARQQGTGLLVQMRNIALGVCLGLLFVLAMVFAVGLLNWLATFGMTEDYPGQLRGSTRNLEQLTRVFLLICVLYVDFMQSAVLGTLVGFYTATYGLPRVNAGGLAFGVFLFVQLVSYALILTLVLVVAPNVLVGVPPLLGTLAQIGLFLLGRECLVFGLWHAVAHRLQADTTELRDTFGSAVRLRAAGVTGTEG